MDKDFGDFLQKMKISDSKFDGLSDELQVRLIEVFEKRNQTAGGAGVLTLKTLFGGEPVEDNAFKLKAFEKLGGAPKVSSCCLVDLSTSEVKEQYRGIYFSAAGHGVHKKQSRTVFAEKIQIEWNGVCVWTPKSPPLTDTDDSEVCLFPVLESIVRQIGTPAKVDFGLIPSGLNVYVKGHSPAGPVFSRGDTVGLTSGLLLKTFLHSGENDDIDEEANQEITSSSSGQSRMMSNYASQRMLSGSGVFSRVDNRFLGTHLSGGAAWRSAFPKADSDLLNPVNLLKALKDAGTTTRYSVFMPAFHQFRKFLR